MHKKVWVIGDVDWNSTAATVRSKSSAAEEPTVTMSISDEPRLKNPALAFSLSLLVWGGGQLYLREYRRGVMFLSAMLAVGGFVAGLLVFADPLGRWLAANKHQALLVSFAIMAVLLGLLVWVINAADAYLLARSADEEPFTGVEQLAWPVLGALAMPGWGQFLNGQPKKGGFFLGAGVTGLFSGCVFWAIFWIYPLLTSSSARLVLEQYLIAALVLAPLALVGWVLSGFDAFRVCRQRYRKKFTPTNVGFRLWSKEVMRELLPRPSVVLGLLLAISVAMQLVPRQFYLHHLEQIRVATAQWHLVVLPEVTHSLMELLGG